MAKNPNPRPRENFLHLGRWVCTEGVHSANITAVSSRACFPKARAESSVVPIGHAQAPGAGWLRFAAVAKKMRMLVQEEEQSFAQDKSLTPVLALTKKVSDWEASSKSWAPLGLSFPILIDGGGRERDASPGNSAPPRSPRPALPRHPSRKRSA